MKKQKRASSGISSRMSKAEAWNIVEAMFRREPETYQLVGNIWDLTPDALLRQQNREAEKELQQIFQERPDVFEQVEDGWRMTPEAYLGWLKPEGKA
jgi:hypothetical protein